MRVLLVHNAVSPSAPPDEADVLVQAAAVGDALVDLGHQVDRFACGLDLQELRAALARSDSAVVFNLVESLGGQGRLIHLVPATLESFGVKLCGCPADAIFLTSHKTLAKTLLSAAGLPTPAWATGGAWDGATPRRGTWIIKSLWEDASIGLDDQALVDGARDDVVAQLRARDATAGAPWFAEAFIEGREFNLAVLDGPGGPQVLPPAEMLFVDYPPQKPRIVGYAAKWEEDSFEYRHTVRTFEFDEKDRPLLAEMTEMALTCWRLLGLRGWARVDFRVDEAGRPWILEVNANPCLSPDAGFAAALAQAQIPFHQAVARILATAA